MGATSWNPPEARRELTWDLANAPRAANHLHAIGSTEDRALAKKWLDRFSERGYGKTSAKGFPALLPEQVIHGDLNDFNVLVQQQQSDATPPPPSSSSSSSTPSSSASSSSSVAVSVLDFGDMVRTLRVFELSVALAYACQNRPTPSAALAAASAVVEGYASEQPLTPREASALPVCVAARLAQSVATSVSYFGVRRWS